MIIVVRRERAISLRFACVGRIPSMSALAPLFVQSHESSLLFLSLSFSQLRKINAASFPIVYQEKFYGEVVEQNDPNLSKFALWRGNIVGAICTRITDMEQDNGKKLYIMTLAVLAPYRGRGIGSQLLQSVLDHCPQRRVVEISLHVHVSNRDAIRFYTERFGFDQGELLENYYRRLDPPHCYLLSKQIELAATSASAIATSNATTTTTTTTTETNNTATEAEDEDEDAKKNPKQEGEEEQTEES